MPMSKTGKKVMRKMMKTYHSKKAKEIFHASINKGVPGSEMWHETDNSPIARYSKKKK